MRFTNPARRNRNIGTPASGHGRNNLLTVPDERVTGRRWYENVTDVRLETRLVHRVERLFFVETLNDEFVHPCSVEDVWRVMETIPAEDIAELNCILFRQPTRKQNLLKPVWGRLTYFAELGLNNGPKIFEGAMVTLEAQKAECSFRWSKSLDPNDQQELDRLRQDGHQVDDCGKYFRITTSVASSRATQLYRTLPHEIGHWVDYLEKVERPSQEGRGDWSELNEKYFQRSIADKEAFANRYARKFLDRYAGGNNGI